MLAQQSQASTKKPEIKIKNIFQKVIAIFSFVLFLNFFFFKQFGSMALVLNLLALFFFLLILFFDKTVFKKQVFSTVGIFAGLALAGFNLIRVANNFVIGISILFSLFLLAIFTYLGATKLPFIRSLMELFLAPILSFFSYIGAGFRFLKVTFSVKLQKQLFASKGVPRTKSSLGKSIFLGLLVSIPVVSVLISMLSNADPIFAKFVQDLLTEGFLNELPARIILSLFLLVFLAPFVFLKRKKRFVSPLNLLQRFSFVHEMSVVMVLVALIMGVFIIVQWPYVFVNVAYETDLSKFGVETYSEYVNKGFVELIKVALFVFALIWTGLIILRGKKENQRTILPAVQMGILAEFVVFIISLFRRIWLYQSYHGWSLARIYGGFLLLWILGMAGTLALRHFYKKRWVIVEAVFTLILVVVIGMFNAEHFIVVNHPPTVNKRVDYVYLSRMSSDGYEGWKQSYKKAKDVLLNPNYETTGFYEEDDRREIAYAGMITYQLSRNYHRLVKLYSDENEWKEYYKKIIQFSIKVNDNYIKELKLKPEDSGNSYETDLKNAVTKRDKLNKYLENLESDEVNWDELPSIYMGYVMSQTSKYPNFSDSVYNDFAGFYEGGLYRDFPYEKTSFNSLDRFYVWNFSENQAYLKMKSDFDFDLMLKMQELYGEYHQNISNQGQSESVYEKDISLNTPFLQSF